MLSLYWGLLQVQTFILAAKHSDCFLTLPSLISYQVSQSLGGAIMPNEVVYSGKHGGICLYFARLLAPLWDGKLVDENLTPEKALVSR